MRNISTVLQTDLCSSAEAIYFYHKQNTMYRIVIFMLFSLVFSYAQAQEAEKPKETFHLKLGAGAARQTVRDDAMSPLIYHGVQGTFQIGGEWRGYRSLHRVDALFWLGEASAESGRTTENYTFAINGGYLHRISQDEAAWQWRVGGMLTTWGSFRDHQSLINSDYFYDVFFSIGPAASVERRFVLFKRDWLVDWQLTVPVLTYGVRPTYSGLDAVPPDDEGFAGWDDPEIGSLNLLQNVKSRIELAYPLKNGNRVGLVYYWDFFHASMGPHEVLQSLQSLSLNLHFKF